MGAGLGFTGWVAISAAAFAGASAVAAFLQAAIARRIAKEQTGLTLQLAIDAQSRIERDNAVRFAERISSLEFQAIANKVFGIAVRWAHGPNRLEYRIAVISGFYRWRDLRTTMTTDEFEAMYPAHDHRSPEALNIATMSEHDALSYWRRTWAWLAVQIDQHLIGVDMARALFAEHYRYYLPFMLEFRIVLERLADSTEDPWLENIAKLESYLFRTGSDYATTIHKAYSIEFEEAQRHVEQDFGCSIDELRQRLKDRRSNRNAFHASETLD